MRILDFIDGFQSSVEPESITVPASLVAVTPSGSLASDNVQDALVELQTDIETRIPLVQKGAANGVATLGSDGKIPVEQVPSIALVDVNVVANIAARDALVVEEGDVARVTDNGSGVPEVYMYNGTSWVSLKTNGELLLHTNQATGAHSASAISVVPTGNLSSVNVQTALVELQGDANTALSKTSNFVAPSSGIAAEIASTSGVFVGPRLTTAQRDALPANVLAGEIFNTTTNKKQIWNGIAWTDVGSGSGSGGINYIANGDAEAGTQGWTRYYNAGYTPTTGVGTPLDASGFTFTTTTVTPLRGLTSFVITKTGTAQRGEGVGYDFAMDDEDLGVQHEIKITSRVISGTYPTGQIRVYLRDVTNGVLIESASTDLVSGSTKVTQTIKFTAPYNGKNFRLMFHCADLSMNAYVVQLDSIKIAPQAGVTTGFFGSDWQTYTPIVTLGSGTLTNAVVTGRRRQVGDTLHVQGAITFTGTPAAFSVISINNPAGLVTDTTKLASTVAAAQVVGTSLPLDQGVLLYGVGVASYTTPTLVTLYANSIGSYSGTAPAQSSNYSNTFPLAFGNNDAITFEYSIPIVGWSSNMVLSSENLTQDVYFRATKNGTQSLVNGDNKIINLTPTGDTLGGWNATLHRYDAKTSERVRIWAHAWTSAGSAAQTAVAYKINGGASVYIGSYNNGGTQTDVRSSGYDEIHLKKDDYVEFWIYILGTTTLQTTSYFGISKATGGSITVAQVPYQRWTYSINSAQSIPASTWTTVIFGTKDEAVDGSYNATTGEFIPSSPGSYRFTATVGFQVNNANRRICRVMRTGLSGTRTRNGTNIVGVNLSESIVQVQVTMSLGLQDRAVIQAYQDTSGALGLLNVADWNHMSIERVGDYV